MKKDLAQVAVLGNDPSNLVTSTVWNKTVIVNHGIIRIYNLSSTMG